MKIVILTTNTDHHRYFINALQQHVKVGAVFYEQNKATFPFEVTSYYEKEEEKYEREQFFRSIPRDISPTIPVYNVSTVNSEECQVLLRNIKPDLGIVFGCGIIKPYVFHYFPKGLLNVHRGIITQYRGLDSELWALYHNDFDTIGVTIHYINERPDAGDIVAMETMRLTRSDTIYQLRYRTTLLATVMMIRIIADLAQGTEYRTKQGILGRYYSAMPAVLKPLCETHMKKYLEARENV